MTSLQKYNGVLLAALGALALTSTSCEGGAAGAAPNSDAPTSVNGGAPPGGSGTNPTAAEKSVESTLPWADEGPAADYVIATRYVTYNDPATGQALVSKDQAKILFQGINQIMSQCKIRFRVEEYMNVNPLDYNLSANPANKSELDTIRERFQVAKRVLVVNTTKWDRSGTLGATGANAWTNMPGMSLNGAVLENSVSNFAAIVAHELGHHLNLDHVSDSSDLMNAIIYPDSTKIAAWQCDEMRSTAQKVWMDELR